METQIKNFIKLFIFSSNHHRRILDKKLSVTGIYRSQHMLLMYLSRHELISQKEIAEHFEISTATVAVSLKKLEKDGYISKMTDASDSRFKKVKITDKGLKIIDESHMIFDSVNKEIFKGFTEEDITLLTSYWERVCSNMTNIEKEIHREEK